MTWKQIEKSREARLWLSQIVIPVTCTVAVIMSNPITRYKVKEKLKRARDKAKNVFAR